ncbi:hypothetical protein PICMEDRAFT_20568, partial [Pichia membranifaciens NRRL Y-2026]
MIAGELYSCSDPQLVKDRYAVRRKLHRYRMLLEEKTLAEDFLHDHVFREFADCSTSFIEPPLFLDYGYNCTIGHHFYSNFNCVMLDCAEITIGNHVMFGPNVQLITATHPKDSVSRNELCQEIAKPITIGDGCWLGAGATVLPGVTLGKNCVVAAGAVVTKSFLEDGLVLVGVPAKVTERLDQ